MKWFSVAKDDTIMFDRVKHAKRIYRNCPTKFKVIGAGVVVAAAVGGGVAYAMHKLRKKKPPQQGELFDNDYWSPTE